MIPHTSYFCPILTSPHSSLLSRGWVFPRRRPRLSLNLKRALAFPLAPYPSRVHHSLHCFSYHSVQALHCSLPHTVQIPRVRIPSHTSHLHTKSHHSIPSLLTSIPSIFASTFPSVSTQTTPTLLVHTSSFPPDHTMRKRDSSVVAPVRKLALQGWHLKGGRSRARDRGGELTMTWWTSWSMWQGRVLVW